jgi:hypothetical protein
VVGLDSRDLGHLGGFLLEDGLDRIGVDSLARVLWGGADSGFPSVQLIRCGALNAAGWILTVLTPYLLHCQS